MKIQIGTGLVVGALALALSGCSSSSTDGGEVSAAPTETATASDTATPLGPDSPVGGGKAVCDDATLKAAIEGSGVTVQKITMLKCVDGWAGVQADVGEGDHAIGENFIFEAEGPFWVPRTRDESVCGTQKDDPSVQPSDSPIPKEIYEIVCASD